jgi:Tfp pilus assembly protein PilV
MIAVAMMAITALGLIASQLWIAREARASALREHAALLADAVIEASRAPVSGEVALRQWNARAASVLPAGEASVGDGGGGVSTARVMWSAVRNTQGQGELIDKPESCGEVVVPAGMSCIAMAFAK